MSDRDTEFWAALAGVTLPRRRRGTTRRTEIANSNFTLPIVESIRAEATRLLKVDAAPATKHEAIFGKILDNLTEIDFFSEAGLSEGERVTEKHQVVITVRQALK